MSEKEHAAEELSAKDLEARLVALEELLRARDDDVVDGPGVGAIGLDGPPEWVPGGGGGKATGFWIYRRNGAAVESLSWADVLALWDPENAEADNFNLEFGVTSGVLDAVSLAGSTSTSYGNTALYDGDAFAEPSAILQSFYRIPIRRSGQWICRGGVFRENRFCTDKGLITELVRIG
jgi:hypothetical protein